MAQKNGLGVVQAADFARVEGNTRALCAAYHSAADTYTEWQPGDFVRLDDFTRMAAGIEAARQACAKMMGGFSPPCAATALPPVPWALYSQWNTAEELQYHLKRIPEQNRERAPYAGEAYLSEDMGVI